MLKVTLVDFNERGSVLVKRSKEHTGRETANKVSQNGNIFLKNVREHCTTFWTHSTKKVSFCDRTGPGNSEFFSNLQINRHSFSHL